MIDDITCLVYSQTNLLWNPKFGFLFFGVSKNSGQNMEALINRSRAEY